MIDRIELFRRFRNSEVSEEDFNITLQTLEILESGEQPKRSYKPRKKKGDDVVNSGGDKSPQDTGKSIDSGKPNPN